MADAHNFQPEILEARMEGAAGSWRAFGDLGRKVPTGGFIRGPIRKDVLLAMCDYLCLFGKQFVRNWAPEASSGACHPGGRRMVYIYICMCIYVYIYIYIYIYIMDMPTSPLSVSKGPFLG